MAKITRYIHTTSHRYHSLTIQCYLLLVRMNMVYTTGSDETDFSQELKETWKRFTSGVRKNVTSLGRTVAKRKTIKKRYKY